MMILMMPVKVLANEKLPSPTGLIWSTEQLEVHFEWNEVDYSEISNNNNLEYIVNFYEDGVIIDSITCDFYGIDSGISFSEILMNNNIREHSYTCGIVVKDKSGEYSDSNEFFSSSIDYVWLQTYYSDLFVCDNNGKLKSITNPRWEKAYCNDDINKYNNIYAALDYYDYSYDEYYNTENCQMIFNLYEDGELIKSYDRTSTHTVGLPLAYDIIERDYVGHEYTFGVVCVDRTGRYKDSDEIISSVLDNEWLSELEELIIYHEIYYDANGGSVQSWIGEVDGYSLTDGGVVCKLSSFHNVNDEELAYGNESEGYIYGYGPTSSYVTMSFIDPPDGKKLKGIEINGVLYALGDVYDIVFPADGRVVFKCIWEDDSSEKTELPAPYNLKWSTDTDKPYATWDWTEEDYAKLTESSVSLTINYYEDGELVEPVSYARNIYGDYALDTKDNAFMLFANTDFRNHSYSYGIVLTDLSGQYADSEEVFSDEIDFEWINTYYNNFLVNDNEGKLKTGNWLGWKKVYWDGDSQKFSGIATSWINNESFDDCYRNDNCSTIINLYEDGSIIKTYTVDGETIGRAIEHDILFRDYEGHIYDFGLIKRDNSGRYADSEEVFSDPLDNEWISELKELIVLHDVYYDANGGDVQTWISDVKGFSVVDGKVVLKLDSFHSIYDTGVNGYGSISSTVYQDFITPPVGKIFKGFEIDGKLYQCEEKYEASIPADGHIVIKCIWDDDPNWVEPTLDGLVDVNGILKYYKKGVLQDSYTGLLQSDSVWYYVQKGVVEKGVNTLVNYGGTWYYVKDSVVDFGFTGIFGYGGTDYYIQKGVLKWGVEGLTNVNGTWYYLNNSAVNKGYT